MLSPYSEAQLLGRFCNFLMKSPNFGTPYCILYTIQYTVFSIPCIHFISTKFLFILYSAVSTCIKNYYTVYYNHIYLYIYKKSVYTILYTQYTSVYQCVVKIPNKKNTFRALLIDAANVNGTAQLHSQVHVLSLSLSLSLCLYPSFSDSLSSPTFESLYISLSLSVSDCMMLLTTVFLYFSLSLSLSLYL